MSQEPENDSTLESKAAEVLPDKARSLSSKMLAGTQIPIITVLVVAAVAAAGGGYVVNAEDGDSGDVPVGEGASADELLESRP